MFSTGAPIVFYVSVSERIFRDQLFSRYYVSVVYLLLLLSSSPLLSLCPQPPSPPRCVSLSMFTVLLSVCLYKPQGDQPGLITTCFSLSAPGGGRKRGRDGREMGGGGHRDNMHRNEGWMQKEEENLV